jgi:hypothetical protein
MASTNHNTHGLPPQRLPQSPALGASEGPAQSPSAHESEPTMMVGPRRWSYRMPTARSESSSGRQKSRHIREALMISPSSRRISRASERTSGRKLGASAGAEVTGRRRPVSSSRTEPPLRRKAQARGGQGEGEDRSLRTRRPLGAPRGSLRVPRGSLGNARGSVGMPSRTPRRPSRHPATPSGHLASSRRPLGVCRRHLAFRGVPEAHGTRRQTWSGARRGIRHVSGRLPAEAGRRADLYPLPLKLAAVRAKWLVSRGCRESGG